MIKGYDEHEDDKYKTRPQNKAKFRVILKTGIVKPYKRFYLPKGERI